MMIIATPQWKKIEEKRNLNEQVADCVISSEEGKMCLYRVTLNGGAESKLVFFFFLLRGRK